MADEFRIYEGESKSVERELKGLIEILKVEIERYKEHNNELFSK
jgi:hypothetical protein